MPQQVEQKVADPEGELTNAQRLFMQLAPQCSVAKRALGIPQLAPQEKQIGILANELKETLLCINLAKKGQHAVRDGHIRTGMQTGIVDLEHMESELRDEKAQQTELDCLNYLASKQIVDMFKKIPTENDELELLNEASKRLWRMENRLDIATKRFCVVDAGNEQVRDEIHRLLIERKNFNIQWNGIIGKLVKGKEYLMDILEIASTAFGDRDECIRKLEVLKWKGLYQLNRDIAEMQIFVGELSHLGKLEEFLRVKGSQRICEADELYEAKRKEEVARCENEILIYDAMLDELYHYTGLNTVSKMILAFRKAEKENFACFVLLCEVLQESIVLNRDLEAAKTKILDQREFNLVREEREEKRIANMTAELAIRRECTQDMQAKNDVADANIQKVVEGIEEIVLLARCDLTPFISLLGNHKEVTKFNISKFLSLLEIEVKSLIEVAYGCVKPPPAVPKVKKGQERTSLPVKSTTKLIPSPKVTQLVPNKIEKLLLYQPCAYCVEDYILNLVFETPAVPVDRDYVEQNIFHLEEVNTPFDIYTLTNPSKRHPYRGSAD